MLGFSPRSRNADLQHEGEDVGIAKKDPQQLHLLKQPLVELLNPSHALCTLAAQVGWREIEAGFAPLYAGKGRRPKAIRLMVSLLMLKRFYGLSDESVVRIWVENPYFQFFGGETVFKWKRPCHPTDLVYFRKRIGEEGLERIMALVAASTGLDFKARPRARRPRRNSETTMG
jgi:IS5 family transposase